MPESAGQRTRHTPLVAVETGNLSREEWLAYRRQGIGGSDVAGIMGISPFRTARDIYYDKLGIMPVEAEPENWVALEVGILLEDLVAKIFHKKSGLEIYQVKKMFRHPKYPFMLADVDYFVRLPDGTTAILEIKTTNHNATDHWWQDGREAVPVYYEVQGRHYMAVMDVDRVFFCCLYGNTEDEVIIREIRRDMAYEQEMIYLEQYFWENHVLAKNPPLYTEDGAQILGSVQRYCGPADTGAPAIALRLLPGPAQEDITGQLEETKEKLGISLSAKQETATRMAFQHNLSIITGPPGTGKTTVLKSILEIYKLRHPDRKIVLMAPTGRASRRMAESTGFKTACTMHSGLGLLGGEPEGESTVKERFLDADLVIVDEFSMVDMWLARQFFSRLRMGAKMMDRLMGNPRVLIVDIGGFTADYLMMRSGRADLGVCDSLENGVILLYNRIRTKANSEFDILLDEPDIDGILKGGESAYAPQVASLVEGMAQGFVNDLFSSLRERMLDLASGRVVFVGGGAMLLRRQIESSGKIGNPLFVEDINANAKGYEFLYRMETMDR